jgi:hypothetical protein
MWGFRRARLIRAMGVVSSTLFKTFIIASFEDLAFTIASFKD